jgi:hypothetical protein
MEPMRETHPRNTDDWQADESEYDEEYDDFARRQTDLFERLIAFVGSTEALWRLDAIPVPDEPFDWSSVAAQDVDFVQRVVARSDQCCDELLDVEFRTIARRILARVAARDPRTFRRSTNADRCAAGLVWLAGQASGEFMRGSPHRPQCVWDWFGVDSCSDRGRSLRAAAGLLPHVVNGYFWDAQLTVGDASLLHSRFRAGLVRQRDSMLEIARSRRTWSVHGDGPTVLVHAKVHQSKGVTAVKGTLADEGRATVLVGFGDDVEDATYYALSVPEAHDLARMLEHALDAPLPRHPPSSGGRPGE